MTFKVGIILSVAAFAASTLIAQEATKGANEAPRENPELEAEIAYVEALVNYGYPDFAAPIMTATKKKWPESDVRFFAIEIRGMLALGKFAEAEKKIAALPDRKSSKYWAARLEVANNHYGRGQKPECMKIYDEFFRVFPKPPKDLVKFYREASYAYGQLLIGDKQYAKAVQRYAALLAQLRVGDDDWCNIACETVDLYLRLAAAETTPAQKKQQTSHLAAATVVVDKLLWQLEKPVYFGRAVSMKAHIEQLRGDVDKAASIIDEYRPQLKELHESILQIDPEGKFGLLKQSPLPECMYLQARMLWDEALIESKKRPKRDDDKIKAFMFGPKGPNGKRIGARGAYNLAINVFLNYETSTWAATAGELSEEIKAFAEKEYKAKIKTKVTKAQIEKVRAAQFREADEKFLAGQYPEAVEAYLAVLGKYPEIKESIAAIEHVAAAYIDMALDAKDKNKKAEYRLNADAVEGYLAERFSGAKEKIMMMSAGDSTIRLAAKEQEYKNFARAESLLLDFCMNCAQHPNAAVTAAAKAMELQKAGKYEQAVRFWNIITTQYTNAAQYATAFSQLATCRGKMGDKAGEIEYLTKYIEIETVNIRKLQAQFQLAQMYQKDGLAFLSEAETNTVAETVEELEKRGTAQILRAIKNFSSFSVAADAALKDPSTQKDDRAKYEQLKEAALFMVGECWGRMTRPEKNLANYRERAAKSYEAYLAAYPTGKYAKVGYVKLGTVYTALGDMAKSKDALDRLSQKFPDSDEAKNAKPRLAKSLIDMGLKREGAEIYSEMLRTEGGTYTPMQFVNAGEALIEAKNWDLAAQAFDKVIRTAGTNSLMAVARARLGQAKSAWKQGSYAEARESLDNFLKDEKLSKLSIAADANFMLVEVASEQGRTEKDTTMRKKYFNAAIGALKKVRQYWKNKPQWEQDQLDLLSGDVLVDRMKAEEAMGLKEEAKETCGKAAAVFQVFIQAHGVTAEVPVEKMADGAVANLERAYATIVPLFSKLGANQADRVMKFGQEYLDLFPEGKAKTVVVNCMNQAKADLPAPGTAGAAK